MSGREGMRIPSRRSIKILHTADVHLGLDGYGSDPQTLQYLEILQRAFSAVIDTAIQENVDLLVIAGDLFDSNRPGAAVVDFAIQELRRAQRPIVMIPGNHDCLNRESIYHKVDFPAACTNLHLITHPDGELHRLPEHNLVLWGRGMVEHEPSYRPLAGLPRPQVDAWHVALAHGFFMEDGTLPHRSSPIYARDIREAGWDYVALGHCHAFREISQGAVTAFYSGAPSFFPAVSGADGYAPLVRCEATEGRGVIVQRVDLRPLVHSALGLFSSPLSIV